MKFKNERYFSNFHIDCKESIDEFRVCITL